MSESTVESAIRKLRNRMWLENIVESLVITLLISSVCILLLSVLGHFTVIVHVFSKEAFLLAASCVAGTAVGLARRPGMKRAAQVGDRLGLQDRLITYLEYRDRSGAVLSAFRRELGEVLARRSPVDMYPVNFRWKRVLAAVLISAVAACVLRPGAPSIKICPPAMIPVRTWRTISPCPTTRFSTSATTALNNSGNVSSAMSSINLLHSAF